VLWLCYVVVKQSLVQAILQLLQLAYTNTINNNNNGMTGNTGDDDHPSHMHYSIVSDGYHFYFIALSPNGISISPLYLADTWAHLRQIAAIICHIFMARITSKQLLATSPVTTSTTTSSLTLTTPTSKIPSSTISGGSDEDVRTTESLIKSLNDLIIHPHAHGDGEEDQGNENPANNEPSTMNTTIPTTPIRIPTPTLVSSSTSTPVSSSSSPTASISASTAKKARGASRGKRSPIAASVASTMVDDGKKSVDSSTTTDRNDDTDDKSTSCRCATGDCRRCKCYKANTKCGPLCHRGAVNDACKNC
jgi:hypothetical protein